MVPRSSERKSEKALRSLTADDVPLCVDLDGTLVSANTLHRAFFRLLRFSPWRAVKAILWIPAGKARFKQIVASYSPLDPATLPYHRDFLQYLREQKRDGRRLILVTGADEAVARDVAGHLQLFDCVIASNGTRNIVGKEKAAALSEAFGGRPFIYAGDSAVDTPVWRLSGLAIVVNGSPDRKSLLEREGIEVLRVFPPASKGLTSVSSS